MVMRSIYWILACCLMFAAVMVMGVSMQSCKSKKLVESVTLVDSVGQSHHQEVDDSLFLEQFFQRNRKKFEFNLVTYRFVKDSSGNVIGSVPDKQIGLKVDNDSTTHHQVGGLVHKENEDSTDVQVEKKQEVKEKPPPDDLRIYFWILFVILLFYCLKN